jgi:hypothetical protein
MTFGAHGDYWKDKFGGTTRNLLRQLYSAQQVAEMLVQEEKSSGFQYDAIFATRLDVLVTHPVPRGAYKALQMAARRGESLVFTPNWGLFRGMNDRVILGHRDAVLPALQRLQVHLHYYTRYTAHYI